MTDQLTVYNLALLHLGERRLSSLSEAREPRRVLDDLWPTVTSYCLAQGMWSFALRASGALTQVSGAYGFAHGYTKPSDVIHLQVISDQVGLYPQVDRDFLDFGATIYTNTSTLYSRYSSNHATLGGMLLSGWTDSFASYVAASLARSAALRITGSMQTFQMVQEVEDSYYLTAYRLDSVHMLQGILPFNSEAMNPLGNEALQIGENLLPFSAYHRAMARARAPMAAASGQQQ